MALTRGELAGGGGRGATERPSWARFLASAGVRDGSIASDSVQLLSDVPLKSAASQETSYR